MRPTMSVSTAPIAMNPSCTNDHRNRERHRRPQLRVPSATFGFMGKWHLVTVAALGLARDSVRAQDVSVAARRFPS